ncbi:MAG: hypothetical protein KAQ87_02360 [Candidatus Pacebacteria bacterium]|nr:hypothetical protein [Candidatus Paceibacterota bacterium]
MLRLNLWKNKAIKTSRFLLVFVLITGWMFSGWPQVLENSEFPPKIQEARAFNETLYVDGCSGAKTQWTTMTNTPYLDNNDGSLIHEDKSASMEVGDFSFANTATGGTDTINSVILYFECQSDDGPSNDGFNVYIDDGEGFTNEGNVSPTSNGSYGWDTLDVSAKLNTWAKIDAATMYLDTVNIGGGDDIYVRRAYLYVDYSTGPSTTFLIGGTETGTKDTNLTTITFPESATEDTISAPYNNLDGSGDPQVLSATVSEPIAKIKNTGGVTYNITLEITTWTNSVANMEYYNLAADGDTNINAVTAELSDTNGTARSVSTSVSIAAGTYKDLYLKLVLSSAAGKTGTSTLTILGEIP